MKNRNSGKRQYFVIQQCLSKAIIVSDTMQHGDYFNNNYSLF